MTAVLEPLRPWQNVAEVTAALERWVHRAGWGAAARRLSLGPEVAEHLQWIGRDHPRIDPESVTTAAMWMLGNVVQGRAATDDDLLRRTVRGFPARTLRHYRQRFGEHAFGRFLEALQQDLDVAALVRGGRSVTAARAWLRANPGKHAKDAPPPRRRAA